MICILIFSKTIRKRTVQFTMASKNSLKQFNPRGEKLSIKKSYLKTRPICKVTFRLSTEEALDANSIFLVGDFNNWHNTITPMKALKKGGFVVTLDLETDREYQFRYFFDRIIWKNDPDADRYVHSSYGDCDNSVVSV